MERQSIVHIVLSGVLERARIRGSMRGRGEEGARGYSPTHSVSSNSQPVSQQGELQRPEQTHKAAGFQKQITSNATSWASATKTNHIFSGTEQI